MDCDCPGCKPGCKSAGVWAWLEGDAGGLATAWMVVIMLLALLAIGGAYE